MQSLPWRNPARAEALQAALARRILIIDGAMGTMIQRHELQEADYRGERFAEGFDRLFAADGHAHAPGCGCEGHDQRGNNDLLSLTRPDIIGGIHRQYLEAGADLVETNTFNSTSISLADYRLQHLVRELNREGARLARAECDAIEAADPSQPRFVIGVLGLAGLAQGVHRRVLDQPQLVGRGGVPLGGEVLHRPPGGFVGHAAGAADDHSTTFTIGWDDSSMYSASSWAWEVAFTVQVMAR